MCKANVLIKGRASLFVIQGCESAAVMIVDQFMLTDSVYRFNSCMMKCIGSQYTGAIFPPAMITFYMMHCHKYQRGVQLTCHGTSILYC